MSEPKAVNLKILAEQRAYLVAKDYCLLLLVAPIILFFQPNVIETHPFAYYFFCLLFIISLIARRLLFIGKLDRWITNDKNWLHAFFYVFNFQALVVGLFSAWGIAISEPNSFVEFLMIINLCFTVSGAIISFSGFPKTCTSYLIFSILPPSIVLLTKPINHPSSHFIFGVGLILFAFSMKKLSTKLFQHISNTWYSKEKLENEKQKMTSLIDTIPGLLSWFDNDLKYISVNKNLLTKLNEERENVIGQHIGYKNKSNSFIEFVKSFHKSDKTVFTREIHSYNELNGAENYYLTVLNKYKINQDTEISALSFDITSIKQRERELHRESLKQLENKRLLALGEMASGIAHEVNNPLSIIQGKIDLLFIKLKNNTLTEDQISKDLTTIHRTALRISKTINALKTLAQDSRLGNIGSYKIVDIIQSVSEITFSKAQSFGAELMYCIDIPDNLVQCGMIEVGQVLINMISNSCHAIEKLDLKWIRIFIEDQDDKVVIKVIDSGDGIPKAIAQKIFDPFFTTKGPDLGTGIGLSLSRELMKKQGGDLYLDENCKKTCFVIELKKFLAE